MNNFQYVKDRIQEDFSRYSGIYFEKLVQELFALSGKYNNVGSYWERDNTNEMDVIACNDHEKRMLIADVKLQAKKLNVPVLARKAEKLISQYSEYAIHFAGYSLDNLDDLINSNI